MDSFYRNKKEHRIMPRKREKFGNRRHTWPVQLDVWLARGLKRRMRLSEELGVYPETLNKWRDTGEIPSFRISKICSITGLPSYYFVETERSLEAQPVGGPVSEPASADQQPKPDAEPAECQALASTFAAPFETASYPSNESGLVDNHGDAVFMRPSRRGFRPGRANLMGIAAVAAATVVGIALLAIQRRNSDSRFLS